MPSKKIARPNTLDIQVPEVLRSGSKDDFLAKLLEFLSPHVVFCVQFVPVFFVRVTFESLESRQAVFHDGIAIDGVEIPVMEADPTVRFVHLHHCPIFLLLALSLMSSFLILLAPPSVMDPVLLRCLSRRRFLRSCLSCVFLVVFGIVAKSKSVIFVVVLSTVLLLVLSVMFVESAIKVVILLVPVLVCLLMFLLRLLLVFPALMFLLTFLFLIFLLPLVLGLVFLRRLLRFFGNAAAVADFDQSLVSPDVASSILARGAAHRRPAADVACNAGLSSAVANSESSVPASVLSCGPFVVCHPDPGSPGGFLVFDFHKLTRRVVVEDSATFEMYRECFYSDNRGPFPVKTVFLPGCPVSTSVVRLDPNVPPVKFPS